MQGDAYWISPRGEVKREPIAHIQDIIKNPRKFGYQKGDIARLYKKHGERIGTEGKAREEVIRHLLTLGWVRIREYPNMYWSVNIERMGRRERDRLAKWAELMVKKGKDKYMPVKISMSRGGEMKTHDLVDISKDALYKESKQYARRRYDLIEVTEFSEGQTSQIMTEHLFLVGDNRHKKISPVEKMEDTLQRVDERNSILVGVEKY